VSPDEEGKDLTPVPDALFRDRPNPEEVTAAPREIGELRVGTNGRVQACPHALVGSVLQSYEARVTAARAKRCTEPETGPGLTSKSGFPWPDDFFTLIPASLAVHLLERQIASYERKHPAACRA
jgi:hypothetical protein